MPPAILLCVGTRTLRLLHESTAAETSQGAIGHFRHFYKAAMYPTLRIFDRVLMRWAMRKFKRLRRHRRRAMHWLGRVAGRDPRLFAHWQMGLVPEAG